jgi:hypothetical protein
MLLQVSGWQVPLAPQVSVLLLHVLTVPGPAQQTSPELPHGPQPAVPG